MFSTIPNNIVSKIAIFQFVFGNMMITNTETIAKTNNTSHSFDLVYRIKKNLLHI